MLSRKIIRNVLSYRRLVLVKELYNGFIDYWSVELVLFILDISRDYYNG